VAQAITNQTGWQDHWVQGSCPRGKLEGTIPHRLRPPSAPLSGKFSSFFSKKIFGIERPLSPFGPGCYSNFLFQLWANPKIFREAATDGAPQAKQVVDRFHLQKNFAQALEKFFRRHTRVLKMAAGQGARKARSATKTVMPPKITPERRARHRQQISVHKRIWKLYRQGCSKDYIAEIVGLTKRSVYRALKQEVAPPLRRRARSSSVVDPYLPYLASRWNQGCHNTALLYKEIVTQGYTGSQRTLRRQLQTFRQAGEHPVSKQTIILDHPPSARSVALMIVRPTQNRTAEQTAYLEQLTQSEATVAVVFTLAQDFGRLLRKREGVSRLEQWKAAVQASGIAELIAFVDGLADDAEAVANGCSMSWSNGMVEGFVNKVKWIKRSSYGQAGFPLLQRRVLLHPAAREPLSKDQRRRSSRKSASPPSHETSGAGSTSIAVAAA
jgi:transposase